MPPRLLITNSVILNGGDACIVLSMAGALRREFGAEVEIKVLCHSADAARRLYAAELEIEPALEEAHRLPGRSGLARKALNETLVPRLGLGLLTAEERRVDRLFSWADAVLSCGGGFMTDRYSPGKRLAGLKRALASGRPLVFYAQSMGPFERPSYRETFRSVLDRAAAITVRDERSAREVEALGLAGRAEVTADEGLLFDAAPPGAVPDPGEGLPGDGPLVAVSLRSWHFPGAERSREELRERYLQSVTRTVEALVDKAGARVVFISTCQGVPEYGHDDSVMAAKAAALLSERVQGSVRVDRAWHHPAELREMLGRCELVVATRMHAAVLALLAGTPALAVGYEAKSAELYARLGLGEWCLDIAGDNLDDLPGRALAMLDAREAVGESLHSGLAELGGRARRNARVVREVLEGRRGGASQ